MLWEPPSVFLKEGWPKGVCLGLPGRNLCLLWFVPAVMGSPGSCECYSGRRRAARLCGARQRAGPPSLPRCHCRGGAGLSWGFAGMHCTSQQQRPSFSSGEGLEASAGCSAPQGHCSRLHRCGRTLAKGLVAVQGRLSQSAVRGEVQSPSRRPCAPGSKALHTHLWVGGSLHLLCSHTRPAQPPQGRELCCPAQGLHVAGFPPLPWCLL